MKVSIITVSFNQDKYLEYCLRSVIDQDYANIEYIVIDAGSTDKSQEILKCYSDRISTIVFESDNGPADGLNKGFSLATGDIIGYVNSDDILLPGAVSVIVEAFKLDPRNDVVFGNALEIDSDGDTIQKVQSTPWSTQAHAYQTAVTVQPSTFIKRSIIRHDLKFNINNTKCWDDEFLVDLSLSGAKFKRISVYLSAYRMYPGTISSQVEWGRKHEKFVKEQNDIFLKIKERPKKNIDIYIGFLYYAYKQIRQPFAALEKLFLRLFKKNIHNSRMPYTRLAWVGGYPAHYMGEFNIKLEEKYGELFFIYYRGNKKNSTTYTHEVTTIPEKYVIIDPWLSYLKMWKWLSRINPEKILITGNYPRVNIIAYLWGILKNRKIYYYSDSNILDSKNLNRSWLKKIIFKKFLTYIYKFLVIGKRNSEFYMSILGEKNLSEKFIWIPLPINNKKFESIQHIKKEEFIFLYLGRLEVVKEVNKLISAYSLLNKKEQELSSLWIAGGGSEFKNLKEQVSKLFIEKKVKFLGEISSNQTENIYSKANALVINSRDEPWGLVVNEAMASGLAVIGPMWIGSFEDLIIDGKNGIVTVDNSPDSIVAAMRKLIHDPELANKMGIASRELSKVNGFNINKSITNFEKILNDD